MQMYYLWIAFLNDREQPVRNPLKMKERLKVTQTQGRRQAVYKTKQPGPSGSQGRGWATDKGVRAGLDLNKHLGIQAYAQQPLLEAISRTGGTSQDVRRTQLKDIAH